MKFIYIDEVECVQKNPNFLGMGAIIIDSSKYHIFKKRFYEQFKILSWDFEQEFKGKYLFSQSRGDSKVLIDKRIEFISKIVEEFNSKKNSRISCLFAYSLQNKEYSEKYINLLENIVKKIRITGDEHKKVAVYFIDKNEKISKEKVIEIIDKNKQKDVDVFERPILVDSDNYFCGIICADIFCYLKSWVVLNPDDNQESSLFEESSKSIIDNKKLEIVREILAKIKNIKDIKV